MMDRRVADQCIHLMKNSTTITTVDLTGGAPELNSQFKSAPFIRQCFLYMDDIMADIWRRMHEAWGMK